MEEIAHIIANLARSGYAVPRLLRQYQRLLELSPHSYFVHRQLLGSDALAATRAHLCRWGLVAAAGRGPPPAGSRGPRQPSRGFVPGRGRGAGWDAP